MGKQMKWIPFLWDAELQHSDSCSPQNRYCGDGKYFFVISDAELLQGLLKPSVYFKALISKNTTGQPYRLQQQPV